VIFELGLFTGYLGRERSLIVRQRGTDLKIPSDLAGVTMSTFDWPRTDNSPEGALGNLP
jgi:predicted nucleotide-binding protein